MPLMIPNTIHARTNFSYIVVTIRYALVLYLKVWLCSLNILAGLPLTTFLTLSNPSNGTVTFSICGGGGNFENHAKTCMSLYLKELLNVASLLISNTPTSSSCPGTWLCVLPHGQHRRDQSRSKREKGNLIFSLVNC